MRAAQRVIVSLKVKDEWPTRDHWRGLAALAIRRRRFCASRARQGSFSPVDVVTFVLAEAAVLPALIRSSSQATRQDKLITPLVCDGAA